MPPASSATKAMATPILAMRFTVLAPQSVGFAGCGRVGIGSGQPNPQAVRAAGRREAVPAGVRGMGSGGRRAYR